MAQETTCEVRPAPWARTVALQRGRLGWKIAAVVLAIALAVAAAAVVIWRIGIGPESGTTRSSTPGDGQATPLLQPKPYLTRVKPTLDKLTDSSTTVAQALAVTSTEQDLPRLARTASAQVPVVQQARRRLAGLTPLSRERAAHAALVRATVSHRRYLTLLIQAANLGRGVGDGVLPAARATVTNTLSNYRTFFAREPEAVDLITDSGIDDL
jgi:hypothetical protein